MALTKISGDVLQQPIDVGIITATSITATSANFSGNVSIAGTLTYEDVTNIDSVGLITARSGIHVTGVGSSVGIGTDNPRNNIQVCLSTPTTVPSAGTSGHNAAIGDVGFGVAIGALNSGKSYIQGTRWDGTALNYDLLLQPNGGSVGIGTDNPDSNSQLHLYNHSGNAKFTIETNETYDAYINFSGATSEASIGYEPTSNSLIFSNAADGLTTAERLRITSTGNVGIGTDNPEVKCVVYSTGAEVVPFRVKSGDTTTNGSFIGFENIGNSPNGYNTRCGVIDSTSFSIFTSNNERLRITSDGKIGIGKTNPQNVLDLGSGTSNRGISWGGTDFNYANIWTEYGSADLHIGQGIRPDGTSSGWVSSYGASSGRTLIKSDYSAGDITFHTAPPSSVADGGAVTVPVRLRITSGGAIGIGVDDPDVALEIAGERIKVNGLTEISESFLLVNNTAYNFDYTVFDETSYGNSFYIICGYNHYYTSAYGAHRVAFVSTRAVSLDVMIDGGNQSHSQAGAWSFSKPNNTTLRITKSAGTYGGSGYGFIKIFTNQL
jgi:hypothetical protein